MNTKRILASIMAAAMMISMIPFTAISATEATATPSVTVGAELIPGGNFDTDSIAGNFAVEADARTVAYIDSTAAADTELEDGTVVKVNNGNAFLNVSESNETTADTKKHLVYTGEPIELVPGIYTFSIDMRHGYNAEYEIAGSYKDPGLKFKDFRDVYVVPTFNDKEGKTLADGAVMSGKINVPCSWGSYHPNGHQVTVPGALIWDNGTMYGYGLNSCITPLPNYFRVGSNWTTAKATFTVTDYVTFTGFKMLAGSTKNAETGLDSFDLDNISLKLVDTNLIENIEDIAPAFDANNKYLYVSNVDASGDGITIHSTVAENANTYKVPVLEDVTDPETGEVTQQPVLDEDNNPTFETKERDLRLVVKAGFDVRLLKDSVDYTLNYDTTRNIQVRKFYEGWVDTDGSVFTNTAYINRTSGWTEASVGYSEYYLGSASRGFILQASSTANILPFAIDDISVVDYTDPAAPVVVVTETFDDVTVVDNKKIVIGFGDVTATNGVTYKLGNVTIDNKGSTKLSIKQEDSYDVATFNGNENTYTYNEAIAPGVYEVSVKVKNDAIVSAAYVSGANYAGATATVEGYIAETGGNQYYRYYSSPSEWELIKDNNTVDVTAKATLADGTVAVSDEITVGTDWAEIKFRFTASDYTTLETISFVAEPTIAAEVVNYPKTLACVGIKDIDYVQIKTLLPTDHIDFVEADFTVDGTPVTDIDDFAAAWELGNKYLYVYNRVDLHGGVLIKSDIVDANNPDADLTISYEISTRDDFKKDVTTTDYTGYINATTYSESSIATITKDYDSATMASGLAVNSGMYNNRFQAFALDNLAIKDGETVIWTYDFSDAVIEDGVVTITPTVDGYDLGTITISLYIYHFGTRKDGVTPAMTIATDEQYYLAKISDVDGAAGEVTSDDTYILLPGVYTFKASFKNYEHITSTLDQSQNHNRVGKIDAGVDDNFDRYFTYYQCGQSIGCAYDNNKLNVTPKFTLGDNVITLVDEPLSVGTEEWVDIEYSFAVTETTRLSEIAFAAKHMLSGNDKAVASIDYATLAFKNVEVEQTKSFAPTDKIEIDETDFVSGNNVAVKANDVANVAGNKYLYVATKYVVDGGASGFYITSDIPAGANSEKALSLELDVAIDSHLVGGTTGGADGVKAKNGTVRHQYYPNGGSTIKVGNGDVNFYGAGIAKRDDWYPLVFTTYNAETFNVTDASKKPQVRTNGSDSFHAMAFDNLRVVDTATDALIASIDFNNAIINADGSVSVTFPNVEGYTLGTVTFTPKNDEVKFAIAEGDDYYTINVTEADGGKLAYDSGETLVPGKYVLSASFKNDEVVLSGAVNGTSAEDTGRNSASVYYDHDDDGIHAGIPPYSVDDGDRQIARPLAEGYITAQGGVGFYRYYFADSEQRLLLDNNKIDVAAVITLDNGEVIRSEAVSVAYDWTEVYVELDLDVNTTIKEVAFEAKHMLSGNDLYEYPVADYARVAFKDVYFGRVPVATVNGTNYEYLADAIATGAAKIELLGNADEAIVINDTVTIVKNGFEVSSISAAAGIYSAENDNVYLFVAAEDVVDSFDLPENKFTVGGNAVTDIDDYAAAWELGNKYLYVYNRVSGTSGLLIHSTIDDAANAGANLTLSYEISTRDNIVKENKDPAYTGSLVGDSVKYTRTAPAVATIDYNTATMNSDPSDGTDPDNEEWGRKLNGYYVNATPNRYCMSQNIQNFCFDNLKIMNNGEVIWEYDFSDAVINAEGKIVITPEVENYNLGVITISLLNYGTGMSNETAMTIATDEQYYLAEVAENADGTAGELTYEATELIVPGTYILEAYVKSYEHITSAMANGTTFGEDQTIDPLKDKYFTYWDSGLNHYVNKDNNKLNVTASVIVGGENRTFQTVVVGVDEWVPVKFEFVVEKNTTLDGVAFEAQHILADKSITPIDYATLAFKDVSIAPAPPHVHEYSAWESDGVDAEGNGTHTKVCSCGDTVTVEHTWGKDPVEIEPTCNTDGKLVYYCVDFRHYDDPEYPYNADKYTECCGATWTVVLDATEEHNGDGAVREEFDEDYHTYLCNVCETEVKEEHNFVGGVCAECGAFEATDNSVAKIGDVKYETLEAALAADGDITLLANVETAIVVNKAVTINKNGFTATVTAGEGFKLTETDAAYVIVAKVFVAEVNGVKYETLAEAIEAVAAGGTIDLLADAEAVTVAKAVTINKNSFAAEVIVDGTNFGKAEDKAADAWVVYPKIGSTVTASLNVDDIIQINYKSNKNNFTELGVTVEYINENARLLVWTSDKISDDTTYLLGTQSEVLAVTYDGTKYYCGTAAGIPAKQMGDAQKFRFCIEGPDGIMYYSDVKEYSPQKYCSNKYTNENTSETLKAFVVALMNYGAAAQKYFNYDTEHLMNSFLTLEEQEAYGDLTPLPLKKEETAVKYRFEVTKMVTRNAASASLEGEIGIVYTIKEMTDNYKAGNISLLYWSEDKFNTVSELTYDNRDKELFFTTTDEGYLEVIINGIPAKELGKTCYFCVRVELDGNVYYDELKVYSIHEYSSKKFTSSDPKMVELAKRIICYSNAAKVELG